MYGITLCLADQSARSQRFAEPIKSVNVSAMAHAAVAPPKYIDGFRIKQFLKYEDLIPVIQDALLNFSARESGGIVQPVRSSVAVEDRGYVCNYL